MHLRESARADELCQDIIGDETATGSLRASWFGVKFALCDRAGRFVLNVSVAF